MSKGLEALKEIKYMLDAPYTSGIIKQGFEIIEKELKEYESYRGFLDNVEKGIVTYTPRDTWEEERKKLKALEIIKSRCVDTYMLLQGCSLPEYNEKYKSKRTRLLANEYELLREVLNK